ncbi:FAD-dependent oxidoreductase [Nonomuraea jiangxiensis]|uniref:FAD/FMN-containing dehydrogenase n=1 Tax=Nonomuraea jiangxiensis TaxID=633440 RepID=A0A1G8TSK5_9ACTN|nr:FAD-dependent oxidoreductase [Nonomuraea jiangxiensis]SDJ43895.1 FAD/FMN-containing dehydrogenase [Nonomuraea jiangxiensis]
MPVTSPHELVYLTRHLDGALILPGDPGWDARRSAWQLAVDQRPAAVVLARSAGDVAATLDTARALGLRVAPQGTGHNAAPLGPLDDTILLRTSEMAQVHIDPARRRARVGAGAVWADVTAAAAEHGLAGLSGTAADVGVVGYTLGGGLSWFARSHGLAANHVTAATVVTGDGRVLRVDAEHEPELYWAIRGGGGAFGVVTELEFSLFPITEVHAGALYWPLERAEAVLSGWRDWTATVPDSVTSVGRLLRFPPLEEIPQPFRGRALVAVEVVAQLDRDDADELLWPLRRLAPEIDTFARTPVTQLHLLHLDPPGPTPATGDGFQVTGLPDEALTALLSVAGPGNDVPLLTVEARHLGGALTPGACEGGAVSSLDAAFGLFSGGITVDAGSSAAVHAALDALDAALAPWRAPTAYRNFTERRGHGLAFEPADVHRRLREVKRTYDPLNLIRANHPVRPAGTA